MEGPDPNAQSWNLWGAPENMQSIFGYEAEGNADHAVLVYLQDHREKGRDRWTGMSRGVGGEVDGVVFAEGRGGED